MVKKVNPPRSASRQYISILSTGFSAIQLSLRWVHPLRTTAACTLWRRLQKGWSCFHDTSEIFPYFRISYMGINRIELVIVIDVLHLQVPLDRLVDVTDDVEKLLEQWLTGRLKNTHTMNAHQTLCATSISMVLRLTSVELCQKPSFLPLLLLINLQTMKGQNLYMKIDPFKTEPPA